MISINHECASVLVLLPTTVYGCDSLISQLAYIDSRTCVFIPRGFSYCFCLDLATTVLAKRKQDCSRLAPAGIELVTDLATVGNALSKYGECCRATFELEEVRAGSRKGQGSKTAARSGAVGTVQHGVL